MNKEIESFVRLQDVDGKIIAIKKQLKEIPQEIDRLYASCRAAKEVIEVAEQEVKDTELKRKEIDIEVESKKVALEKLKGNQSSVKTNKEYTAILNEIESIKEEITALEDKELEMMEAVEEKKSLIPPKIEALEEEGKKFEVVKAEKEKELDGLKENLALLEKEREGIVGGVSENWLGVYENLLSHKDGIAVVPLLNGNCHGCHTDVPPQFAISLRKGEEVMTCPNCDRIIYLTEE